MGKGKRGPPKGEGGKHPFKLDMDVVTRAASIGCTITEIAALVGMSTSGLHARLERDEPLATAIEEARGKGCATLRRYQWQQAAQGNTSMLIWLGKNYLGQTDRQEIAGTTGTSVILMHLNAARAMSAQLIDGQVEPAPQEQQSLLDAPTPTE